MNELRRCTSLVLATGVLVLTLPAAAQDSTQDGIARNLLERQQQETDFHVKLYDNTLPKPAGSMQGRPFVLETSPRSLLDLGDPLPTSPITTRISPAAGPDASGRRSLDLSQQQRLQQLQLQNKNLDEPMRQQQTQIQQLQFDRENQAQQLRDHIMRDSQSSMQQIH